MSLLARRYAAALFDVAEARGSTAQVLADLDQVHLLFSTPEGKAWLTSPQTPRDVLRGVVERALAGGSELTRNTASVLLHRRREDLLPELAAEVRRLARAKAGEVEAVVETARPLEAAEADALAAQLTKLSKKRVVIRTEVNPEVIAGVRVRIGNTLYDGSLLGELEALHRHLLQAPVAKN